MKLMRVLLGSFCLFTCAAAISVAESGGGVAIQLKSATEGEREAQRQLERILESMDLRRWLFTHEARIAEGVIPHSHPILTVNTNYLDDDPAQAATFIHEQLHWFVLEMPGPVESAIADLRTLYAEVPTGHAAGGARSEYSTYLHLLICTLELDAMTELYGEKLARQVLESWRHYRWIYTEVLEQAPAIREILRAHGLSSPDARTDAAAEQDDISAAGQEGDEQKARLSDLIPPGTVLNAEGFETNGFNVRSSRNSELNADFTPSESHFDLLMIEADDVFRVVFEKGRPMSSGGGVGIYHRTSGIPMLTTADRNGDGRIDIVTYSVLNEDNEAIREVVDYDADGQADLRIHFDEGFGEIWHLERWYRIEKLDGTHGITVDGIFKKIRNIDGRPTVQ